MLFMKTRLMLCKRADYFVTSPYTVYRITEC